MIKCETCDFWARDQFGRALGGHNCDGSVSECRRHAPSAIKPDLGPLADAKWPSTNSEDWCGDYSGEAQAIFEEMKNA